MKIQTTLMSPALFLLFPPGISDAQTEPTDEMLRLTAFCTQLADTDDVEMTDTFSPEIDVKKFMDDARPKIFSVPVTEMGELTHEENSSGGRFYTYMIVESEAGRTHVIHGLYDRNKDIRREVETTTSTTHAGLLNASQRHRVWYCTRTE